MFVPVEPSRTTTVVTVVYTKPHLLQTDNLFAMHLSESQGRFNLSQICQNSKAKNLRERQFSITICALFPNKACCVSQSEHVLYRNFIIR